MTFSILVELSWWQMLIRSATTLATPHDFILNQDGDFPVDHSIQSPGNGGSSRQRPFQSKVLIMHWYFASVYLVWPLQRSNKPIAVTKQ